MEDRVLRTNQIANRYQDCQTKKLGSPNDNYYLKNENWNSIDEKNKNQFRNYEQQTQNQESKMKHQLDNLRDKEQYDNNNTNLKQSYYYYEQIKPQSAIYQQKQDTEDQIHMKTEYYRQKVDQQIQHSFDRYYNKTPMDSRSNFYSKTIQQNNNRYQQYSNSGFKTDFQWPEFQRINPQITRNKTIQQKESTNLIQQDQRSLLDIEYRLQQRREEAQRIAVEQERKLNYYSKSLEYSQRQQQVQLKGNQDKINQFQKVQERLKNQVNQQNYRNFDLNIQKNESKREIRNKNEMLEEDQNKYNQLEGKLILNERENNYSDNSRINRSRYDQKSPQKTKFIEDSKFQQVSYLKKQPFDKRQELDSYNKLLYVDKSLNHKNIKSDYKYEETVSNDRLLSKQKVNYEINQNNQQKREDDYRVNNQSQGVQKRLNLLEKLQQFDQKNNIKYCDEKLQNNNCKSDKKPYEQNQLIEPADKCKIKIYDQQIQDQLEFKRSQFQPEINQIRKDFDKKYGQFNPDIGQKYYQFDNQRDLGSRFRPEQDQKYYQKNAQRFEQRHSYAIEDKFQGTAYSKQIQRENNQNIIIDRVKSFNSSKINYQKSPGNDQGQQQGYDRLKQLQNRLVIDRYPIEEYQKRLPQGQDLQKYIINRNI